MSNLQLYTLAYVHLDGTILAEEASISIHRATNSQPVNTVHKGYAGESPGAANCTIQVTNAVPSSDFERDPGKFMRSLQSCEIGVQAANRVIQVPGFIIEDTFKHSVGSESTLEFTFRGVFPEWI